MAFEERRKSRAEETPVIGGLPDVPGIIAAMQLSAGLAVHLRGLADELLVKEFPGSSLSRAERELLATSVSAQNECVYCMDSHGAFARELLSRAGEADADSLVERVQTRTHGDVGAKLGALLDVARTVARRPSELTRDAVQRALSTGATDADTQLAVLIAAAFCMYNRMVDGLRSRTPASEKSYRARAVEIADHGYSDARVRSVPGR